ncbi:MAG: hypothetical protein JRN20_14775 [Nitrososphaerota archaeon]|nr:hypothetical protein [Nitrososphaerota archaeon]
MNVSIFCILYTPLPYLVSLVILYFLSYFRDPLRFMHPRKERGQEIWRDALLNLGLVTKEQLASPAKKRKLPAKYVPALGLAAVQPISGWIVSSFVFSSSMLLALAFALLVQFLSATVILFLVVIPVLGSTAHVWRKHVSNLGSPKKRLGSRASHLVDLGKKEQQEEEKIGERRLPRSQMGLDRGKRNEQLPGGVHDALPPAAVGGESEVDDKPPTENHENENELRSRKGVVS